MGRRWKYQIKKGLPFGIAMPILLAVFEGYGTSSYADTFLSEKFAVQLVVFLLAGIFIIGYSSWREKAKNEMYNKN